MRMSAIFAASAVTVSLLLASVPSHSQSTPSPQTTPTPAVASPAAANPNTVPEGTAVLVELQDELKSGDIAVGTSIHFTVVRAVAGSSGTILIPSGADAYGHITESKRSGFLGAPGKLAFACDYVSLPNGTQIPLRAQELTNHGGDSRGASIATAILFTPFTLFARGGNAKAHKGQQYTFYVDRDTTIEPAQAAATQPVAAKSLFVLASGGQVVGSIASFDGQSYVVATDQGNITLKASDISKVYALTNNLAPATPTAPAPSAQMAAAATPAPAPPAQQATPAAPAPPVQQTPPPPIDPSVIGSGQHVIVATNDGNSYYGTVQKFDGTTYTVSVKTGSMQIAAADIKSVQYPDRSN